MVSSEYDSLAEKTLSLTDGFEKTSRFRISARRLTKDYSLSSIRGLGLLLSRITGLKWI